MRIYCITQGTVLNALWLPKWEGNFLKKEGLYVCIADSLCYAAEINKTL